jgi:tape measure domain-containing protein
MSTNVGSLSFDASINLDQFRRDGREMISITNSITDAQKKQSQGIEDFAKKAAQAAAGFLSIQAATGFVKSMIEVRGQFQQIEVAFGTMLKSKDAADKLMTQAVQLAAITPFTLQEVASGAKQLLAYGFAAKDVTKQLETLGNIASGVGSDLNGIVYLYGTLKASGRVTQIDINQFAGRGIPIYQALADVMKINVDQVRSYVSAGKIGFPQVEAAFKSLTSEGGQFFNLMQEQSKTLTGQLSNLEDAWSRMLNDLGKRNEGLFSNAIGGAIDLVNNYQKIIDILELLIITYGAYRAALILQTASTTLATLAIGAEGFAFSVLRNGLLETIGALELYEGVTVSAAATTALITGVVASLTIVLYSLAQAQTAESLAQDAVNKSIDAGGRAVDSENGKIQALIDTIQSHTSSVLEKKEAYTDLQKETNGYLRSYSLEEIAAGKAAGAIALLDGHIQHLIETQTEYAEYKKMDERIDELNKKGIDAVSTFDKLAARIKIIFDRSLSGTYSGKGIFDDLTGNLDGAIVSRIINDNEGAKTNLKSKNPDLQKIIDKAAKDKKDAENAKKAADDAIKKFNDLLADGALKNFDKLLKTAPNKDSLDKLQKALTDAYENLAPGDKQKAIIKAKIQQVDKFIADEYGTSVKAQVKAANDRAKFLDELSKTEAKATGKALDQNGEAINAIHTKYEELRKKAASLKLGSGVTQRIDNLEKKEIGETKYEQDTKLLKDNLEKQKNLQIEYEADVEKFGIDAAKNKYAGLLVAGKSYYTQLLEDQKAITDIPVEKRTGNQNERLKIVNDLIAEETKRQRAADDERLAAALSSSETFNVVRLKALDDYLKQKKIIEDAADVQDKDVRISKLQQDTTEKIQAAKVESIKKLEVYRDLSGDISKINEATARKDIETLNKIIEAALKAGLISKKDAAEFRKLTSDASLALNDKTYDKMLVVAGGLDKIAQSAEKMGGKFGGAMGVVLSSLSSAVSAVANVGKLSDALKNATTDSEKFSANANLIATGISAVTDMIGMITSAAKQRKEAAQAYLDSVTMAQNAYNLSLNEEIRLRAQLNGNVFYKDYKADILNASLAVVDANKKLQDAFVKLQSAQIKTGTKNAVSGSNVGKGAVAGATIGAIVGSYVPVVGTIVGGVVGGAIGAIVGLFGGKKKVDVFGPLLGVYPDLIQKDKDGINQLNEARAKSLIMSGLLTAQAKIDLQNTIDLAEARKAAVEQINSDISALAGSLGDDLRNSLIKAFEDGTSAAKAFGDSVSKVIENIVSQFLFNDIFGKNFDKLQADLKASFGIDGDQNATDDLVQFYKDAGPGIKQFQDALAAAKAGAAAQGLDIFSGSQNGSDLTNAIKGMTAPQADLLAGQFGGQRLATLEGNRIATNNGLSLYAIQQQGDKTLEQLIKIETNTRRGADNTDGLIPTLKSLDTRLESIDKKAGAASGTAAANGIVF